MLSALRHRERIVVGQTTTEGNDATDRLCALTGSANGNSSTLTEATEEDFGGVNSLVHLLLDERVHIVTALLHSSTLGVASSIPGGEIKLLH